MIKSRNFKKTRGKMAGMIITVITEEEKATRTGLSAEAHLKTLQIKADNSIFEQEVTRKIISA